MSATASGAVAAFSQAVMLSNEQCNINQLLKFSEPLTKNGWHYHKLITVVSGVAGILCIIISGFLMLGHLLHWTKPDEQRQLVRIIFTLPTFAVCSFFSVKFYQAEGYLTPIPLIVECFGIVALFYFYVTCVTPNETLREQFYDNLERQRTHPITKRVKGASKHPNGSLRWFHVTWILVFQLLLGRIATTVATEYVVARHCPLSKRRMRGTLAISLVTSIQTTLAVLAVINYERRMKKHLQAGGHRALAKLVCFKLIVFVELVQEVIFKGLGGYFVLRPTTHISYRDITVGTPEVMLSVEVFIVSVLFLYAYTFAPYRRLAKERPGDKRTFFRAVVDVVNIADMLKGVEFMFRVGDRDGKNVNADGGAAVKMEAEVVGRALGMVMSTDSTLDGTGTEEMAKGQ